MVLMAVTSASVSDMMAGGRLCAVLLISTSSQRRRERVEQDGFGLTKIEGWVRLVTMARVRARRGRGTGGEATGQSQTTLHRLDDGTDEMSFW
jgi:hypothetical protein